MPEEKHHSIPLLHRFKQDISSFAIPERFTFPFYYQPHPLCEIAAREVQSYLQQQVDWHHDFGLENTPEKSAYGKMFGVLLVRDLTGELGYLTAFSGKLADKYMLPPFVPALFDLAEEQGFFKLGEAELNALNRELESRENSAEWKELLLAFERVKNEFLEEERLLKTLHKAAKAERKAQRERALSEDNPTVSAALFENLENESRKHHFEAKDFSRKWKQRLLEAEETLRAYKEKTQGLKEERKNKSAMLQQQLFDQYHFLNAKGEKKSVLELFQSIGLAVPPAGAGECAAPKLLQYAFQQGLQALAMAEFWWGKSPASEIRQHGQFYPACKGKCEPILGHMLQGLDVDINPLLSDPEKDRELPVVYEDEFLLLINKPAEMLSVPGKTSRPSVYDLLREKFPEATGPLIVHRLDMSTSGLLLVAKSLEVYQDLQRQFTNRTVKKRYVALLDGILSEAEGVIELPLRVDLDDRPRQLVCYEHGKWAKTIWKMVEQHASQTRVHFYPVTGRTHQLRVHAAHPKGLNAPITGDDLYGSRASRLFLHADFIEFVHPVSKKTLHFQQNPDF